MGLLLSLIKRVLGMFAPYQGEESDNLDTLKVSLPALRYYAQVVKPYRWTLTVNMFAHIFMAYLFLPSLMLIKYFFDTALVKGSQRDVLLVGASIFALGLLGSYLGIILRKRNVSIMTRIIADMRKKIMRSLLNYPTAFFHSEDIRALHARVTDDLERLNILVSTIVSAMFPASITALGIMGLLAYIDRRMFLLVLLLTPVLLIVNMKMTSYMRKYIFEFNQAREKYISHTSLLFNFTDLIKSRATEEREADRHDAVVDDLRTKSINRVHAAMAHGKVQDLLSNFMSTTILVVGGIAVLNSSMSMGNLLMFIVAANMLRGSIGTINNGIGSLIEANESLNTLHRILMKDDKSPYAGTRTIGRVERIEYKGVSFAYHGKYVLNDIDIAIDGDEKVAIVGPNGSGKSSLIKLLMGHYRPQGGVILYNGIDAEEIDYSEFRRRTGIVPQNPLLWPDTLLANLTYGVEDCTMGEVEEACRIVGLTDFIRRQPKGYESFVGDNGIALSGGEKQKIAIARALLGKPMMLILDEPTNHLDQQSIRDLLASIVKLEYKPTIVVISHNESIRSVVDRVITLHEGRLVGSTDPTPAKMVEDSIA